MYTSAVFHSVIRENNSATVWTSRYHLQFDKSNPPEWKNNKISAKIKDCVKVLSKRVDGPNHIDNSRSYFENLPTKMAQLFVAGLPNERVLFLYSGCSIAIYVKQYVIDSWIFVRSGRCANLLDKLISMTLRLDAVSWDWVRALHLSTLSFSGNGTTLCDLR